MRSNNPRFCLITVSAMACIACGTSEPEPPATLDYEATSWVISGAINADALAEGATLSLLLREGQRVNGTLFMPASIAGGTDLTADMAGNWNKNGDTIRFNQISQTFVSEVPWILTPEMLTTADSVDGSFYDVELTRFFR
jgi:hypothetical protein